MLSIWGGGGLYLEGLLHGGAYFRNFTVTSENKTTHTPPPSLFSPPLLSKYVSLLLSTGSSNSGTTLHGGV